MRLPFRLVVVSRHGAQRIPTASDASGHPIAVVPDVESLLSSSRPAGAIIVNAAAAHAPTALRLLDAAVPVLVEKPAATHPREATLMLQAARKADVALVPALTYLHCAYLENYARLVRASAAGAPAVLAIEWTDTSSDARYGEQKDYDRGIGVAMDVMPHVWAILATVLGCNEAGIDSCQADRGGRRVVVHLRFGHTACKVLLEREAPARRRAIRVEGGPSIDFSAEPGVIESRGVSYSGDAFWGTRMDRPIRRQLDAFLQAISAPPSTQPQAGLEASVRVAYDCDAMVKEQQRRLLAVTRVQAGLDDDTGCALRELLASSMAERGRLQPGDRSGLEEHVRALQEDVAADRTGSWLQALARRDA